MADDWRQLSKDFKSQIAEFRALEQTALQYGSSELAKKIGLRRDSLIGEQQAVDEIIASLKPEEWSYSTFRDQLNDAKRAIEEFKKVLNP